MMTRPQSLAIAASMVFIATNWISAELQAEAPTQDIKILASEQLRNIHQMRREAAMHEYATRMAEFKAGRSPVNVVLQANRRLLHASLATDSPNAAIEYDRRASEIEVLTRKSLELGTGTNQEVAQAGSARLDAILKDLLFRPGPRNN